MTSPITPQTHAVQALSRDNQMRNASHEIEASFLSTILNATNPSTSSSFFGGGIGEEQFKSFLVNAQASVISESGAIGLAESLFQSLAAKYNLDE